MPADVTPSSAPSTGIYLSGLQIHNASWDSLRSAIKQQPASQELDRVDMPFLWLKPVDKNMHQKNNKSKLTYKCPVYISGGTGCLSGDNVVVYLELPTLLSPAVWTERNVYMSCKDL